MSHPLFHARSVLSDDRGSVTAEYAVVVLAAVSLAGLLVALTRGGELKSLLFDMIKNALSMG